MAIFCHIWSHCFLSTTSWPTKGGKWTANLLVRKQVEIIRFCVLNNFLPMPRTFK